MEILYVEPVRFHTMRWHDNAIAHICQPLKVPLLSQMFQSRALCLWKLLLFMLEEGGKVLDVETV